MSEAHACLAEATAESANQVLVALPGLVSARVIGVEHLLDLAAALVCGAVGLLLDGSDQLFMYGAGSVLLIAVLVVLERLWARAATGVVLIGLLAVAGVALFR